MSENNNGAVEISVQDVMSSYETEIGRLNGVIIKERLTFGSQIKNLNEVIQTLAAENHRLRTAPGAASADLGAQEAVEAAEDDPDAVKPLEGALLLPSD